MSFLCIVFRHLSVVPASGLFSLRPFVLCCVEGPTSYFRLSGVRLAQEMHGGATMTTHLPELLLNNFTTRLGRRVARQLAALFPLVRALEKRYHFAVELPSDLVCFLSGPQRPVVYLFLSCAGVNPQRARPAANPVFAEQVSL